MINLKDPTDMFFVGMLTGICITGLMWILIVFILKPFSNMTITIKDQ